MIDAGQGDVLNVPHTRGDEPMTSVRRFITWFHVPHTRGDEPVAEATASDATLMFPTHVGMNRRR